MFLPAWFTEERQTNPVINIIIIALVLCAIFFLVPKEPKFEDFSEQLEKGEDIVAISRNANEMIEKFSSVGYCLKNVTEKRFSSRLILHFGKCQK